MLKIDMRRAPHPVEVLPGIVFTVRPINTAMVETARAAARRALHALEDTPETLAAIGWEGDFPPLEDPDFRDGAYQSLFIVKLAQLAIMSWDGVVDQDDGPLPVSNETVEFIMTGFPDIAMAFHLRYMGVLDRLAEAKKGSGPLPIGGTVAVPDTAKDAAPADPLAPVE